MDNNPKEGFAYTIQAGDTLWLLAQRFHTSKEAILSENPLVDESYLRLGQIIWIPQINKHNQTSSQNPSAPFIGAEQELNNRLRLYWEQHVYWTRAFILSVVFELPDPQAVLNRLLQNPYDFAEVLQAFYGEEVALDFANLFTEHIRIAGELVKAAKAGDSVVAEDTEKRWYENANQIAEFFGIINPYWSAQEWEKMLFEHLALIKLEAVNLLNKQYVDSITIFNKIEQQAMLMADKMTWGIVNQFSSMY